MIFYNLLSSFLQTIFGVGMGPHAVVLAFFKQFDSNIVSTLYQRCGDAQLLTNIQQYSCSLLFVNLQVF